MKYKSNHPFKDFAIARLISKAPELFEMLQRIYNGQHIYPEIHKEIGQLLKSVTEL